MKLRDRRDKLFAMFDRGIITESETRIGFVALMLDAKDDTAAFALCDTLPAWFRVSFRNWLTDLADRDYAYRCFGIGDSRRPNEVAADSKRHQEILSDSGQPSWVFCNPKNTPTPSNSRH